MLEKKLKFGEQELTLSIGKVARQADAAVLVNMSDTVVLVTAVIKQAKEQKDFLPLTINYQEKAYAAGKIPGGYFKREGRAAEHETLTARLIDRPIRPLFPKGYCSDIQVIATVMSLNPEVPADIPALIGAAAALSLSGVPFEGPLAAARVGYSNGIYQLNPTKEQLKESQLDLVVAGTKDAVLMVESEAKELPESVMLGAVMFGHEMMQPVIKAISEMREEMKVETWEWSPKEANQELEDKVNGSYGEAVETAYLQKDKMVRQVAIRDIYAKAVEEFAEEGNQALNSEITSIVHAYEKTFVRKNILSGEPRIDGRDTKTVRDIQVETDFLPRTHGSCLFTRGETQAIVVATIGTDRDQQIIDALDGERKDRFMLHYNFPPYCVGEIGMQFGPKRREIGHGKLARRAIEAVLPNEKDFPYVVRVVSEITESNGSSSMASVCGASLALMDAGVPISAPVSGVAMGLIKEGDDYAILTDILGDEDHLGDMDFKVAGTATGITALQMDIKVSGITKEIMEKALEQAKEGRLHILNIMNNHMSKPNEMSSNAPKIYQMQIPVPKIKDVIGKGGATIRSLTENTTATIDIDDNGLLKIFASESEVAEKIKENIKNIIAEVEVGNIYDGKVVKIVEFGAFVAVLKNKEGLLHISQISEERVDKVTDVLTEGQEISVKVIEKDRGGRFKLSMREAQQS